MSGTTVGPNGGIVRFPGGQLIVDPGVFTQTVSLQASTLAQPPQQPPNTSVTSDGPVVAIRIGGQQAPGTFAQGGPSFTVVFSTPHSADLNAGSLAVVDLVDSSGAHNFFSFSSSASNGQMSVPVPGYLVTQAQALYAFTVVAVAPAAPSASHRRPRYAVVNPLLQLTDTGWLPYPIPSAPPLDPELPTLVLTHGMNSTVEGSFVSNAGNRCANAIQAAGKYSQVIGFEYDWTEPPDLAAPKFAAAVSSLHLKRFDVEAHSYGTIVTAYGIAKGNLRPTNVVFLGGPIKGTPLASVALTVFLNMPPSESGSATSLLNFPIAASSGMIFDLQSSATLNPFLPTIVNNFAFAAEAGQMNVVQAGGTTPWFLPPQVALYVHGLLFASGFSGTYDGIVPIESATAAIAPVSLGPVPRQFPVTHIELECDPAVRDFVASSLRSLTSSFGTFHDVTQTAPFGPAGGTIDLPVDFGGYTLHSDWGGNTTTKPFTVTATATTPLNIDAPFTPWSSAGTSFLYLDVVNNGSEEATYGQPLPSFSLGTIIVPPFPGNACSLGVYDTVNKIWLDATQQPVTPYAPPNRFSTLYYPATTWQNGTLKLVPHVHQYFAFACR